MPPLAAEGHRRDAGVARGARPCCSTRSTAGHRRCRRGPRWRTCARGTRMRWKPWPTDFCIRRRGRRRCGGRAVCGGGSAGVFHPGRRRVCRPPPAAAAAARAVPLLRLDAGVGRGDRVGPNAWSALSVLLALLDGVEPCARHVHHLRRGARTVAARGSKATPARSKPRPATCATPTRRCCIRRATCRWTRSRTIWRPSAWILLVAEAGWARHAPNPLLLIASGA